MPKCGGMSLAGMALPWNNPGNWDFRPDSLRSELVDFNTLFPPGPTRDYLMENCMGCHGDAAKAGRMTEPLGTAISVCGAGISSVGETLPRTWSV